MVSKANVECNLRLSVRFCEFPLGNFVAISAPPDLITAEKLYQRAVHAAQVNAGRPPNSTTCNAWSLAASFPRQNGSGSGIASDSDTASWLAVVGTCFHQSGSSNSDYLLRQYLRHGADQLSRSLEGFFAVVIGDGKTQEITVITDIIGSCHFYSRQVAGVVALSSSSLVLASLAEVSPDPVGCQEFLGMGIIYEDRTIFREIKKLPAASIVKFRNGVEVERRLYWDVSSLSPDSLSAEAATEALWETLVAAVTKIGSQYDKIVCDLTGGYDSRAMAAAFLGAKSKFDTAVSGPDDSADVVISRGLARKLGLKHIHNVRGTSFSVAELEDAVRLTDGEFDVVEYAGIARTHKKLSESFQISINGSFGEVARGYWWELLFPHTSAHRSLNSHKLAERRYAVGLRSDLFQPAVRLDLVDHMASVIDRTTQGLAGFPNTFQMDVAYLRMRMQRWQGRIASSTNKLWPCLSPFMFRSVLETMLQADFAVRLRSLLVRQMLATYQPEIAEFPLEHGYPAVPATWRNLPQFWKLAPYYGNKVATRIRSRIFTQKKPALEASARLQLWRSEEVQELLRPEAMFTAAVLEPSVLAALIESSQRCDFLRVSEWNRILTLELANKEIRAQAGTSV